MGQIKNIKLHIVTDIKVSKKQQKQQPQQQQAAAAPSVRTPADEALYNSITEQGNKIRNLKSAKADKATVLVEVEELKKLKAKYKEATGQDYVPPSAQPATTTSNNKMAPTPTSTTPTAALSPEAERVQDQIVQQGDKIRLLKADKATKDQLKPEIDVLLKLKGEYKELTGSDYQPPAQQPKKNSQEKKENTPPAPTVALSPEAEKVKDKIVQQGDKIRQMKQDKVGMDKLKPEIDALLKFKGEFKEITGTDYQAPGANPK